MPVVTFMTHPEVQIDPQVPVPNWTLTAVGRDRVRRFARSWSLEPFNTIWSSAERKAQDCAEIATDMFGVERRVLADLAENDRSATGYLPRDAFEATADQFFAHPEASIRGWERAIDAQARIIGAIQMILSCDPQADSLLVCAHGGVGALLLCHLKQVPIRRVEDQPSGSGNYYRFTVPDWALVHGWKPIDP